MRIAHVVATASFAGTERYVADVACATARVGHQVSVFGGAAAPMAAALDGVDWTPAASRSAAVTSLARAGRYDVVHAHLTDAEAAAVMTARRHQGRVIATRHIAAPRGRSRAGRTIAPYLTGRIATEIAISRYVAAATGLPASAVLPNGVPTMPAVWSPASRTVVMAQRLEAEKDTATGLRAWARSGLAAQGWQLLVAGVGTQREWLDDLVESDQITGVEFLGAVDDMAALWSRAGLLLAPAPAEPLGLTVLEAMAAGVPVLAALAGGHLETVGSVDPHRGFAPGDVPGAAAELAALAGDDGLRGRLGGAGRSCQQAGFDLERHVAALLERYQAVLA